MLSFFSDKQRPNESGVGLIRFPVTQIGKKSTIALFVRNDYAAPVELESPQTNDPDLTVTNFPRYLAPGEFGAVSLTFAPKLERVVPLSTEINFEVVIG